jgi:predicted TIM-barrel fold metal-dependent hydrolase
MRTGKEERIFRALTDIKDEYIEEAAKTKPVKRTGMRRYMRPLAACLAVVLGIGGMIGMKLWIATFCDDPLNYRFIEKCIDYDIPILLHAWRKTVGQRACESTPERVANIAKRYPEGTFIMAHIAGNCYYGVKPVLDCENVYIDFCGSVFRADDLEYAVELVGAKRILFGTDMPGSYLVSEGQVWEANISEEEKEMIMWKNTARLFYKEKVE